MDEESRGIEIRAELQDFGRHISLVVFQRDGAGRRSVAAPLTMVEHNDNHYTESTVKIYAAAAQQLMDDLWRAGVRPTEGQGSAGQIGAVQAHLADMRKLVSKQLEVDL